MKTKWRWIFARAYGILFFDFLEAASLALVMTTFSEVFGTVAGVFTLIKFMFFVPLVFISLGVGAAGIVVIFLRKRKDEIKPN